MGRGRPDLELEAAALEVRPTPRTKRRLLAMGSSEGEGGAREEMGIGTRSDGAQRWEMEALREGDGIGRRVRLGLEGRGWLGLGMRMEQAWPGCWAAGLLLSLYL